MANPQRTVSLLEQLAESHRAQVAESAAERRAFLEANRAWVNETLDRVAGELEQSANLDRAARQAFHEQTAAWVGALRDRVRQELSDASTNGKAEREAFVAENAKWVDDVLGGFIEEFARTAEAAREARATFLAELRSAVHQAAVSVRGGTPSSTPTAQPTAAAPQSVPEAESPSPAKPRILQSNSEHRSMKPQDLIRQQGTRSIRRRTG